MLKFEDALRIVLDNSFVIKREQISFMEARGRVLADDILSDMDMPPFNKSAVDGYACRKEDTLKAMELIEIIPAGAMPQKKVLPGQCSKIMTGAPVPDGADTILMVEDTEEKNGFVTYLNEKVKDNVCYRGEDILKGGIVIPKGSLIQPQHIAVLATVGAVSLNVVPKIKVAVISTGDELVEPGEKPTDSQIRNSNAYQLISQIERAGGIPDYIGIARDTEASTREMISKGFQDNDIILLSGGVSMGDFDHVPKVLNELGVETKFKSIAVQPGRPTVFGSRDQQFIFGLPGNPVSSFVQFELLVKPLMLKMMNADYQALKLKLPLAKEFRRKKASRMSWKPVRINAQGEVEFLEYHGSAHINALTEAEGLTPIPIGVEKIEKGEIVDVRQI